ncbi:MAG: 30S ribosomal protein S1, partial [Eggerthellaceae bacterium]
VGDEVKVKVMEINPERRRISLSMKAAAEELGFEIPIDETVIVEERPAKKKAEKPEEQAAVAPEAAEAVEAEAAVEPEAAVEEAAAPQAAE